jgi:Zn finger protein HypA/HybF involved in hydrogenase expression
MAKLNKLNLDEVKKVVAETLSASEACRRLGMSTYGAATRFRKFLDKNKIDYSHWTGQLWSKGKTSLEDKRIKSTGNTYKDIFCEDSAANATYVKSLIIKKELLPYKCSVCNMNPFWNGKVLKLQMDHINGNKRDQRLENLRMICPNCHSQTETFGSKNKIKGFPSEERIIEVLKNTYSVSEAIRVLGINKINIKKLRNIVKDKNIAQLIKQQKIKICISCNNEHFTKSELYCSRKCAIKSANDPTNWEHGNTNTYEYRKCRCELCKKANTDNKKNQRNILTAQKNKLS